jgi:hypothetical protein
MCRYRERRRRGLSCIKVQLRRSEVDALIARGLLEPAERQDRRALAAALHRYLDANPMQDADGDAQRRKGDVSRVSQLVAVRSQYWRAQYGAGTDMKANRDG